MDEHDVENPIALGDVDALQGGEQAFWIPDTGLTLVQY